MKTKPNTKPIADGKNPCKNCTTPNICRDFGAWNNCKLQPVIKTP